MKNTLYQSLLSRLKNKHSKLAARFHKSVKDGEFQKQRFRKRKDSIERLKSLEKRINGLGKESGLKVSLNHKHWALALAMGVVVSAKAQVSFDPPVELGQPYIVRQYTGDLDGDGDLDGLFMSYIGNPVILLNQGGLTFTENSIPINSAGIIEETSFFGDFDGDGDLDLIVREGPYGAATFGAWINDGSANFTSTAVTIPTFDFDDDKVFIGDVDGDGDADIVLQEESPNYVNVLVNTGLTFTPNRIYGPSLPNTNLKILMDVDGDTDLDIVLSAYDGGVYPLFAFLNNGSGTFSPGSISTIYNVSNDFRALDIDNDSDLDILYEGSSYPNAEANIFLNNGIGGFTQSTIITIPNNEGVDELLPFDINNDNFDDFVINTQADSTFIYQSDGLGGFTEVAAYPGASIPGDLDGDADGDLFYFDGNISIRDNQGGGSYVQGPDILSVSVSYDTDLVDIDGDGDLDIVTGSQLISRVWLNDGAANFTVGQEIGTQGYSQVFGDLDGDGDPDMIRAIEEGNYAGLDIWTNAGGTLSYNQNIGSGSMEFMKIGLADIDGDTDLDIIALVDGGSIKYLRTFRNDGGLSFAQTNNVSFFTDLSALAIGDIDGDTDIDLVVGYGYTSGGFVPFTNDSGTMTQGSTVIPPLTGGRVADLDLIDLDGDTDLDILFTNSNGFDQYRFSNNGSGIFTDSGQNITISTNTEQGFVGDIDNDGDNDIIFGGYVSFPEIWLNDGIGNFTFDSNIPALSDEYTQIVLGDLDGDTDIDVAFGGYYVGSKVFLNQAILPAPEINVQGNGVDIASGDTTPDVGDDTDFGNGTIGVPVVNTFTIQNTGTSDLNLSSIGVSGLNAADFTISNVTTPAIISAGTDITFDVNFDAGASGARVATIDIANDDADESFYSFDVTGNGQTAQEINVQGSGIDIASGDTTPDVADGTDFGNVTLGQSGLFTFTIQNTGEADLDVSSIAVSGVDAADFTISNITTPATVAGGTDVTFDVTFNPSASGARVATIDIANDDSDEALYSFDITGLGQTEQEINVQGSGIDIASGDTTPDVADGTDFGNVTLGQSGLFTFTIQNTGEADLDVSSIAVSGVDAADFVISNVTTPATVAGGTDITFDVTFNPSASGIRAAAIDIVNDDSDESLYSFDITGLGQTEQEINVQGSGIDIASGDTTPDAADGTDFGNAIVGQTSVFTFTIQNTGEADLNVSSIDISGLDAADFTISNVTTPVIVSGGTDITFDLELNPSASGIREATIDITNDDSDESLYSFDVTGFGQIEQEINVQGGGVTIVSGDTTPDVADGTDFGNVPLGQSGVFTFTIQNIGEADLDIGAVVVSGPDLADYTISNITTPTTVAGGTDLTFDVTFTPSASGARVAAIDITSNDSDESIYSFDISGIGQVEQEINIQGGGVDIANGDTTPDLADGTDFGTVTLGQSGVFTFTIQNVGEADLNVASIAASGANSTDFVISNITTPATVPGLTDVTFDVTFTPSASGIRSAIIDIASDDADEAIYSFDIVGTGQLEQEINVQGNGIDIASGDITPDPTDGTDFGDVTLGQPAVITFTIQNTGEADLNVGSIAFSGANAIDFTLASISTPAIVPGGGDVTFDIVFSPTAQGARVATVTINNDDTDEAAYTFDLAGNGQNPPDINVQGGGIDILTGDVTPDPSDGTDFGEVIIGTTATNTFTIQNTGEADLNISGVGPVSGDVGFFPVSNITTPVAVPGGSDITFDISYVPTGEVSNTVTIGIISDDLDETLYSFDLTGSGIIDPLVVDSLAVVAFYNNNDGVNWTENTNWLEADQNIEDWFGVDLNTAGDRVEVISLPNNNLSGTLSNDLNTLDALVTLDLSDNNIDGLDTDFSGLTGATTINLDGNQLDFGDLEPVGGVGALTYDNQANIDAINEVGPIEIPVGSNQTLTSTVNGTANTYQWVLNGTDVTGETNASININDINRSNMGTYELKVSNTIAEGVTLTSNPIDVFATAVISVDATDSDTELNITENINAYLFEVTGNDTPDTLDVATQTNVISSFSFPAVVLGDYIVAIESVVPLTNPDGSDNTDVQYLPTYFGDQFESELADTVKLNNDVSIEIVMTDAPPLRDETTGSGTVSGTIEDDFNDDASRVDARRRAARRKCGLKRRRSTGRPDQDDDGFELIAYGETNDQGEFEYGFLPVGTYRFFVEYPGIPLDESSFVQFDIGEAGVSDDSFVLAVFASPEGIEIELVLGITSQFFTDFSIYPNPTTDLLNIEYDKILGDQLEMEIIDLEGKSLMKRSIPKNQNKLQLDTSILSPGQYLIKFVDKKNTKNSLVYRLIKK